MKLFVSVISFITIIQMICAQSKDEQQVKNILSDDVAAWNSGDINQFMQAYWQSDSLKFIGKNGITYGWQATLKNYKKNYPDTAAMGKLAFDLIEVKQLSPVYVYVIGKWQLTRSAGDLSGHFTLLFKKINGKWVIIADHSS
jgi:ketosteroid isomerase-like protein